MEADGPGPAPAGPEVLPAVPVWPSLAEWRERLTWRRVRRRADPDLDQAERAVAEGSIARSYEAAGLAPPMQVIWVGGPGQAQSVLTRSGWRRAWAWGLLGIAGLAAALGFVGPAIGLSPDVTDLPQGALVVLGFLLIAPWIFAIVLTGATNARPRPDWKLNTLPVIVALSCILIGTLGSAVGELPPLAALGALLALPASIALAVAPAPEPGFRKLPRFGRSVGPKMSNAFRHLLDRARESTRPRPYGLEMAELLSSHVRLLATASPPNFDTPVAFYAVDRLIRVAPDPNRISTPDTLKLQEKLAAFSDMVFRVDCIWAFSKVAVAMEPPVEVHLDERGRFHHMDGPAVRWKDGSLLFAVEGRFPADPQILFAPETLSALQIRQEPDPGVRRALISHYGPERIMREMGRRVAQDKTGELWRVDDFDGEPLVMVRVINSSPEPDGSFKPYWLRVPPSTTSAHAGVAWTFGLSPMRYDPQVET